MENAVEKLDDTSIVEYVISLNLWHSFSTYLFIQKVKFIYYSTCYTI